MHIALVEDDIRLNAMMLELLRDEYEKVEPLFNGPDAVQYILNQSPDVVLLDNMFQYKLILSRS